MSKPHPGYGEYDNSNDMRSLERSIRRTQSKMQAEARAYHRKEQERNKSVSLRARRPGAYASSFISTHSTEPIDGVELIQNYDWRREYPSYVCRILSTSVMVGLVGFAVRVGGYWGGVSKYVIGHMGLASLVAVPLLCYQFAKHQLVLDSELRTGPCKRTSKDELSMLFSGIGALVSFLVFAAGMYWSVLFWLIFLGPLLFNWWGTATVVHNWFCYGVQETPTGCMPPPMRPAPKCLLFLLCSVALSPFAGPLVPLVVIGAATLSYSVARQLDLLAVDIEKPDTTDWTPRRSVIHALRRSSTKDAKDAFYLCRTKSQNAPVVIKRKQLYSHMAIQGAPNAGKTSTLLLPLLRQAMEMAGISTIVIDLKALSNEIHAEGMRNPRKKKHRLFHNLRGRPTCVFILFEQDFWLVMLPAQRAQFIHKALNFDFGGDYGKSFFAAVMLKVLLIVFNHYDPKSWRQLQGLILQGIRRLNYPKRVKEKLAQDAMQVLITIDLLAEFDIMSGDAKTVQLSDIYRTECHYHFHLNSAHGSMVEAMGTRFFLYALIAAREVVDKESAIDTLAFVDEIHVAAAKNVEWLFQAYRSSRIALIATVQDPRSLNTRDNDLQAVVMNNVGTTVWLTVSDEEARRIQQLAGTTIEPIESIEPGTLESNYSYSMSPAERLNTTEIYEASSAPLEGLFMIRVDDGFARFDGLVHVGIFERHVSYEEHLRMANCPFPTELEDSVIVGSTAKRPPDDPPGVGPCPDPDGPQQPPSPFDSTITTLDIPERKKRVRTRRVKRPSDPTNP